MFQMIRMFVKARTVLCYISEGLKEKNYNFSLKMKTREREFFSEHSTNYRNQTVSQAVPVGVEKLENENYQNVMEEAATLRIQQTQSAPMNRNDIKLPDKSFEASGFDFVDTANPQETPILEKKSSVSPRKVGKEKAPLVAVNPSNVKKDLAWDYTDLDPNNSAPFLEVISCFL